MIRKKKHAVLVAAVFLASLSIVFNSKVAGPVQAKADTIYEQIKLFTEVFMLVRDNYIEEKDTKSLIYGAARGMVQTLDPFSEFMEPAVNQVMKSETEGYFGGLGIRIAIQEGVLTVVTPLPNTPAYRAGILPGDRILNIEGKTTKDITLFDAVQKLRGDKGTKVTISVQREGEEKLIDFTITRDIVKLESVPLAMMVTDRIGYIELTEFSQTSTNDFHEAMKKLQEQGMQSLILDLRFNPGGLLNVAVEICKEFVGEKKLIVYTKGRKPEQDTKFFADEREKSVRMPLVVLVNKGSASGSEIVAGCIQDWKRGLILGQKTFGKASVQSVLPLSDGSGLRITTAKYYTPSGRCIHELGIEPDVTVEVSAKDMTKLMSDRMKIYNVPEEKRKELDKEKVVDIQLERAKEILTAQNVFSGQKKATEWEAVTGTGTVTGKGEKRNE